MMKWRLLLTATCLLGSLTTALGAVYHVAPNGDDLNDGLSWSGAKQTLQAAVDAAGNWDTVLATNGVYDSGGRLAPGGREPYRVCIEKTLHLLSVNGPEHTFIVGQYSATSAVRGVYIGGFALVSGFTITNCYATISFAGGTFSAEHAAIDMSDPSCVVANCDISGCYSESLYVWGSGVVGGPGRLVSCRIVGNNYGVTECSLVNCEVKENRDTGVNMSDLTGCAIERNSVGIDWCTAKNCVIAENGGGAVSSSLTNCLITGNDGGGAFYCTLANCTVVGNSSSYMGGGALDCRARNCIIVSNTAPEGANWSVTEAYVGAPPPSFDCEYTCTYPLPEGGGNISDDPCFIDYAGGDFHLASNSPCIDWGDNACARSATDLDGADRIQHDVVDMGAYESPYTVRRTLYVSTNGTHRPPFRTWETAATNLQKAFDSATADDTVLVSDGSYRLYAAPIRKNISLHSENGPENTRLLTPGLHLSNALACVSGFTIQGQSNDACVVLYNGTVSNCIIQGGSPGVTLMSGLLTSCEIRDNVRYPYWSGYGMRCPFGGGIYMTGGMVEYCLIEHNWVGVGSNSYLKVPSLPAGGGVCMNGGVVRRSCIRANTAQHGFGGGVSIFGGMLENCLIYDNNAEEGTGGGIYASEENHVVIDHCTLAYNEAYHATAVSVGTATNISGWRLRLANSILWGSVECRFYDIPTFAHCCSITPLPGWGNIVADPHFADPWRTTNLQLNATSPCIDAGSGECGVATDLLGAPRPLDGDGDGVARCDMGCYEFVSQTGDTDGDGLSDRREINGLSSHPLLRDSDGDGQDDYAEFVAGASASDPYDCFQLNNHPAQDDAGWVLSWAGVAGRFYDVMVSTNLCGAWSGAEQGTDLPGVPGLMTYTARTESALGIYRVKVRSTWP
ncbi:MAG TPA: hypothetical protein DCZ95_15455 [Verrucomicrobia bacterium]|nr:hypothetical protein [Verrucomicrobiota bacterium]